VTCSDEVFGKRTVNAERAPTIRGHDERVLTDHIGPRCGKREQATILGPAVDPVLPPVTAVNDELEVTPEQRMEPVSHPDTSVPIILIRCS
jgi:hypothetical protein